MNTDGAARPLGQYAGLSTGSSCGCREGGWTSVVTIYIVEDDPGVSDSLRSVLQAFGHTVGVCSDAETLIRKGPPEPTDTVIVDLGLPGVGGAALMRWLMELAGPPRVICISGQAQKAIEEALRGIPFDTVLRKPLSADRIVELL